MTEADIMKKIQKRASQKGWRLWRNNVGCLEAKNGVFVRYGLCVGSSDLIGFQSVEITSEMVGKKMAVFMAVEVKAPTGRLTDEQSRFLKLVRESGGVGVEARSESDI